MGERASVLEVVQIGVEATPGTPVAANKKLPSLSIIPKVKSGIDAMRTIGNKFTTIHAQGKEWSESEIGGEATYSELPYLLSSIAAFAVPVQQGATTAHKWVHAPSPTAEDAIKTFTVEKGQAVRAHKSAYGLVTELSLEGDRENIELSGSMLARAISDGITLTAAPTVIEQIPILPKEVDVFLDTTSDGLGATKLTRLIKWGITLKRFAPLWVVDSAQASWVAHLETPVEAQVTLMLEADAQGMALLSAMRDGSFRYMRLKATSPKEAGAAFPYSFQFDAALQVADEPDGPDDEDDVQVVEFTFDMTADPLWGTGKACQAEVVNKQSAL